MKNFVRAAASALVLFVATTGIARSADDFPVPPTAIVGTDKPIPLGELADLSVAVSEPKSASIISFSETWKVFDVKRDKGGKLELVEKKLREYTSASGSRGVFFAVGNVDKEMQVQVAVTYLYVIYDSTDKTKVSRIATKTVVLNAILTVGTGGAKPVDPVNPPTPPAPKPDLPVGKFGLAKFVYDSVAVNTSPESRKPWAAAHVAAYEHVIADAKAGKLSDQRKFLEATAQAVSDEKTKAKLTTDAGWAKVADAVQNAMYQAYVDKKLNTLDDFVEALVELTAGLKAFN